MVELIVDIIALSTAIFVGSLAVDSWRTRNR